MERVNARDKMQEVKSAHKITYNNQNFYKSKKAKRKRTTNMKMANINT